MEMTPLTIALSLIGCTCAGAPPSFLNALKKVLGEVVRGKRTVSYF